MSKKEKVKKPFYKKWWVWVLAIIVVIIIANSGGGSDTASTPNNNGKQETKQTNKPKVQKKEKKSDVQATIGENFKLGKITFKVVNIQDKTSVGDQYAGKKSGGTFKLVKITVTNNDKEAHMMDSSFFKLKETDGTAYDSDSEASMYADPNSNFLIENINPKMSKTGIVVFDIPKSAKGLELQVQTGFWGTETGLISLK